MRRRKLKRINYPLLAATGLFTMVTARPGMAQLLTASTVRISVAPRLLDGTSNTIAAIEKTRDGSTSLVVHSFDRDNGLQQGSQFVFLDGSIRFLFGDGSVRFKDVRSNETVTAAANATSANLLLTNIPNGVAPMSFEATIQTSFTTPESNSIATTKELDLGGGVQAGVASGSPPPADPPVVQLIRATHASLVEVPDRFLVEWNIQAAPTVTIERYGINATVTYAFKQTTDNRGE
jgi:hypothetical protein